MASKPATGASKSGLWQDTFKNHLKAKVKPILNAVKTSQRAIESLEERFDTVG
jgi:hypothetical protein